MSPGRYRVARKGMTELTTALFAIARMWLLFRFLNHNSYLAWIVGASEGFAIMSTLRGLARETVETESRGVLVPLCYCTPLLFHGEGAPAIFPLMLFVVAGVGQLGIRLYMGWHVTVGVPMFRYTLTRGPYAFVRHPLAAVEILLSVAFVGTFPGTWNAVVSLLVVVSSVLATRLEERFLVQFPSYLEYREKVSYSFVPGLV